VAGGAHPLRIPATRCVADRQLCIELPAVAESEEQPAWRINMLRCTRS